MPKKSKKKEKSGEGLASAFSRISPFVDTEEEGDNDPHLVNVIVETPKGSRNKITFDEEFGVFALTKVLPAGAVFPFDFGFIPNTLGEDGDPLDVLVLMDEPVYPGCLVQARLIGVIEAEQTERDGRVERNDRLLAVAAESHTHGDIESIHQLNEELLDEITHFFISYNEVAGKEFKPLGRFAAARARKVVEEASGE